MTAIVVDIYRRCGNEHPVTTIGNYETPAGRGHPRCNVLGIRPIAAHEKILHTIRGVYDPDYLGDVVCRSVANARFFHLGDSFLSKNSAIAAFTRRLFR